MIMKKDENIDYYYWKKQMIMEKFLLFPLLHNWVFFLPDFWISSCFRALLPIRKAWPWVACLRFGLSCTLPLLTSCKRSWQTFGCFPQDSNLPSSATEGHFCGALWWPQASLWVEKEFLTVLLPNWCLKFCSPSWAHCITGLDDREMTFYQFSSELENSGWVYVSPISPLFLPG